MAAHQATLPLGFSRQEHCSGSPLPSPWLFLNLPNTSSMFLFFTYFHFFYVNFGCLLLSLYYQTFGNCYTYLSLLKAPDSCLSMFSTLMKKPASLKISLSNRSTPISINIWTLLMKEKNPIYLLLLVRSVQFAGKCIPMWYIYLPLFIISSHHFLSPLRMHFIFTLLFL